MKISKIETKKSKKKLHNFHWFVHHLNYDKILFHHHLNNNNNRHSYSTLHPLHFATAIENLWLLHENRIYNYYLDQTYIYNASFINFFFFFIFGKCWYFTKKGKISFFFSRVIIVLKGTRTLSGASFIVQLGYATNSYFFIDWYTTSHVCHVTI